MSTRAFRPTKLAEALSVLADHPRAVPLAGGTDLMVTLHAGAQAPATVVDLSRLPELCGIRRDGEVLDVGAACTFSELCDSPLVREGAPLLAAAAAHVGAWQIQNRATLGGNIANASPAGDSLPVLLACDAELVLDGQEGRRVVRAAEMFHAYRKTALVAGELIVRVRLPFAVPGSFSRFRKVGTRAAQSISKVVLAVLARRDTQGALCGVRVAAGSVAAVPLRLAPVEAVLEGQLPTLALAERAAGSARGAVHPIDDVRSTAAYRSYVLGNLVRRVVLEASGA